MEKENIFYFCDMNLLLKFVGFIIQGVSLLRPSLITQNLRLKSENVYSPCRRRY